MFIISQVGEWLAFQKQDGSLEPRLATSWKSSNGAKTWTFKIRKGVKFNDGTPVTVDDIVYTYKSVFTANPSRSKGNFTGLLDANGIIDVKAKDRATSKEQQVRITGSSMLSKDDVDRMVREAKEHEADDKARREAVDFRNQTEALAFQAEKTLTDLGEKVDSVKKVEAEKLISEVREALKGDDQSSLRERAEALAKLMSEIGSAAYAQQSAEGQGEPAGGSAEAGEETIEGEAKEV